MKQPLINYHTHTWRCQHASGTEEEYVLAAIRDGYSVLGFADHTPWPYQSSFVSGIRMTVSQLDDYISTIRGLAARYADEIYIPLGLECEAFPEYTEWLRELKEEKLDFVILGNHFDTNDETGGFYFGRCTKPAHVRAYAERTIAGMETGLFDYVAHPDLYCNAYETFDADCAAVARDLCAAAEALDLPLEMNLLGMSRLDKAYADGGLGYPSTPFWEIAAQYKIRAIIGLDAHKPEQIHRRMLFERAEEELSELGIEVVRTVPGLEGAVAPHEGETTPC